MTMDQIHKITVLGQDNGFGLAGGKIDFPVAGITQAEGPDRLRIPKKFPLQPDGD